MRPFDNISGTPQKRDNRSVASAAVVQGGNLTGQSLHSTQQTEKEAAIIALRVGIEALFADVDASLLGSSEEVHALIRGFFEQSYFIGWPDFSESLSPLKKAERRWFFNEFYGLFHTALDSGVRIKTIQAIAYAPILAADRDARRDEADEAYLAQRRADRREAREAQKRWMEGDQL